MVIKIKESVSNVPMMPEFGILNDTITVSKGRYPDNTYKNIQIPKDKLFKNFAEFCIEISNYIDYELPYSPRNFESIEFERIPSKLTLSWYNDDNTFCQLFCCLYVAPSPLTEYDLDKFEIPLKG